MGTLTLTDLLKRMVERGGSDLHITTNSPLASVSTGN